MKFKFSTQMVQLSLVRSQAFQNESIAQLPLYNGYLHIVGQTYHYQ